MAVVTPKGRSGTAVVFVDEGGIHISIDRPENRLAEHEALTGGVPDTWQQESARAFLFADWVVERWQIEEWHALYLEDGMLHHYVVVGEKVEGSSRKFPDGQSLGAWCDDPVLDPKGTWFDLLNVRTSEIDVPRPDAEGILYGSRSSKEIPVHP